MITEELKQVYLDTQYEIFNPAFTIKIGEISRELQFLLTQNNVTDWAYITSYNPYSEILSDAENLQHFELLKADIKDFTTFEGQGRGTDPNWKPEKSLLILGIARDHAILIGKKYCQNAIVTGGKGEKSELVILV